MFDAVRSLVPGIEYPRDRYHEYGPKAKTYALTLLVSFRGAPLSAPRSLLISSMKCFRPRSISAMCP